MHVAVIGSGIAGLSAALRLAERHEVTVFEAGGHIGGHTNTVQVRTADRTLSIDTGFIVFNNDTYPGFSRLLAQLDVPTQPGEMSFSVRDPSRDFEYCGSSLNGLFAQRRNIVNRRFHRLVLDILDFNRAGQRFIETGDDTMSLRQYLATGGWGQHFADLYIVPMGAAIWSMPPAAMLDFPALYFLRFFANHGLLQLRNRPEWRTIVGGAACYVDKLTQGFRDRILLHEPVRLVQRHAGGVRVCSDHRDQIYDAVFFACHSDQALRILDRPHRCERNILGSIAYSRNRAVLHTDTRLLPYRQRAWASWNYRLSHRRRAPATLTYNMNRLQQLPGPTTYCVTLNSSQIDPSSVVGTYDYEHPIYTRESVAAQQRYDEINGLDRLYYCGAYWGYGFHEDGYQSAQRACSQLEQDIDDGKLHLRRVG